MRDREADIAAEMLRCKHFTGIHYRECRAGVVYMQVRDTSGPGMAKFPCLSLSRPGLHGSAQVRAATTVCEKRELPTRAEAEAIVDERARRIAEFTRELRLGVCTVCKASPSAWEQSGSCIYAVPCGHRVGQGDAKKYAAGVLEERAKERP